MLRRMMTILLRKHFADWIYEQSRTRKISVAEVIEDLITATGSLYGPPKRRRRPYVRTKPFDLEFVAQSMQLVPPDAIPLIWADNTTPIPELAKRHGVTVTTMRAIKQGATVMWRDPEG
jgi:hypothetical protein